MTSCHMGAAPETPDTFHMELPEKFPIQTPTVYREEKPTHQLSLMSLLVPVFAAAQKRRARAFSYPKVRLRASLSASMSDTMKDASLENTLFPP